MFYKWNIGGLWGGTTVFYKWNIGGLWGGTTCSTSGTLEVYEVGRRVLQVEHWRFMRWDDVFYKWNIGGL